MDLYDDPELIAAYVAEHDHVAKTEHTHPLRTA